ncbi:MAG: hypothetical protein V9H69_13875 [Anaerolineae bacterium]
MATYWSTSAPMAQTPSWVVLSNAPAPVGPPTPKMMSAPSAIWLKAAVLPRV